MRARTLLTVPVAAAVALTLSGCVNDRDAARDACVEHIQSLESNPNLARAEFSGFDYHLDEPEPYMMGELSIDGADEIYWNCYVSTQGSSTVLRTSLD